MNYSEIFKDLNCNVKINEMMSPHTTFKIGGMADLFLEVNDLDSLKKVLCLLKSHDIPFFIIGNGSNLLVDDEGYNGAIIKLTGDFEKIYIDGEYIECGSGCKLSKLCTKCLENSLTGLEFAYGIPGSFGGAIFMNAGAYGNEIKEFVEYVKCIDDDGNIYKLSNDECKFDYRKSIFSENKFVIISAKLKLSNGKYEDIKNKMQDFISKRKSKQPLEYPSAGSFFKCPTGYHASALIDECGLKGFRIGDAAVSSKHAGFVVNLGNASSKDIINLQSEIISKVETQKNILLDTEVIHLKNGIVKDNSRHAL